MAIHYFRLEGDQLEKASQLNPYESPTNIIPAVFKHNLKKIANLQTKEGGNKGKLKMKYMPSKNRKEFLPEMGKAATKEGGHNSKLSGDLPEMSIKPKK